MKNSFNILGFWFHLTWNGNIGIDQHGNTWTNPNNPKPKDSNFVDRLLDGYNTIIDNYSCCGDEMTDDSDICPTCKEHC